MASPWRVLSSSDSIRHYACLWAGDTSGAFDYEVEEMNWKAAGRATLIVLAIALAVGLGMLIMAYQPWLLIAIFAGLIWGALYFYLRDEL